MNWDWFPCKRGGLITFLIKEYERAGGALLVFFGSAKLFCVCSESFSPVLHSWHAARAPQPVYSHNSSVREPAWAERETEVLMMLSDREYKRGPPVLGPGSQWWMKELTFRSLMSCVSLNSAYTILICHSDTANCRTHTNTLKLINKQLRSYLSICLVHR